MNLSIFRISTLTFIGMFISDALCLQAAPPEQPATLSASELAGRLAAKQQDGTSLVRAKMDGAAGGTLQLQIKSRASRGSADLCYQVLWPKERKGEAVILHRSGSRASGTVFTASGTAKQLGASQMDDPLFGSALSYADVIDNYFEWDQQTIVGNETVERVECVVLESKPGKGSSIYSSIKTWVDPRRLVPVQVEKYGSSGKAIRKIRITRVVNDDRGRPVPASFSIQGPGGTTELDGSRIKHGVALTDADFSAEGLKAAPNGPEER